MQTLAVQKHPFGMSLSHDGQRLYVVNVLSNSVSIVQLNQLSEPMQHITVGEHPYCVVESLDGRYLMVTNTQDDDVSVIDLTLGKQIKRINVGAVPEGIDIDPITGLVLVANWSSGDLSLIDSQQLVLIKQIKTGDKSRAFGQFILQ
jgi:YVTN family beta-propeller protein